VSCKTCTNPPKADGSGGISGIRWNCCICADVDLCTACYFSDKHDTSHIFWRLDRANETSGKPKVFTL
jgi:hypothetical protein